MPSEDASEDQSATIAFLTAELAREGGEVQRIDTHISTVLMAGDRVFKLKRAVRLPYLDFSTPELRAQACDRELALNLRTAPALYAEVRRIHRNRAGALAFGGPGGLADAIVVMRRFDQRDLFDVMARDGRLDAALLTRLALGIAAFHSEIEPDFLRSGVQAVESALVANEGGFGQTHAFDPLKEARLFNLCRARFDHFAPLLDRRGREGRVRRCHGDLHLRNICLFKGQPMLFDCLEFDENLATTDVLYDLAFLLMDLVHRGLRAGANVVFNRYVGASGDDGALALLPFFMAIRAAVRAHVGVAGGAQDEAKVTEARDYLDLALELLTPREPRLVVIAGLSGSGKSSVAAALAPALDLAPGARILSTDRLRKKLAGIAPEERLPPESYTPEASRRVYALQCEQAARILAGGWSVIADGVFLRTDERAAIEAVAQSAHVRCDTLWLEAPPAVLAARVAGRAGDPSDATVAVLERQLASNPGAAGWTPVSAAGSIAETVAAARAALI